jgi:predicted ATPase
MLVGRADEVHTLTRALEDAIAGRGSVVFVAGEAGIGKSRLVAEAVALQNLLLGNKRFFCKGCRQDSIRAA